MSGYNRATIVGNLGADAELRQTSAGPVLKLRVAATERTKGGERTQWFDVSVFGKRGEALDRLGLTKGTRVLCAGPVSARAYESGGEPRSSLEMVAFDVELLGGGRDGQRSGGGSSAPASSGDSSGGFDDDSDLPF